MTVVRSDLASPMSDGLRMRLILELIESIQDTQEQLVALVGSIAEQVADQRHMLAAAAVERNPAPEYRTPVELRPGNFVWWPGGDTATLVGVSRCGGADECWFIEATDGRTVHTAAWQEWRIATPGERMGFE